MNYRWPEGYDVRNQFPGFRFSIRPLLHLRSLQEHSQALVVAMAGTDLAGLHFLLEDCEFFSVVQNLVSWWGRRPGGKSRHFGMIRFNDKFQVLPILGRSITYA